MFTMNERGTIDSGIINLEFTVRFMCKNWICNIGNEKCIDNMSMNIFNSHLIAYMK